jgi:hypothetical protein
VAQNYFRFVRFEIGAPTFQLTAMDSILGMDPTVLAGRYWTSIATNFSDVYLFSVAVCVVVIVVTIGLTSKRNQPDEEHRQPGDKGLRFVERSSTKEQCRQPSPPQKKPRKRTQALAPASNLYFFVQFSSMYNSTIFKLRSTTEQMPGTDVMIF